MAYIVRVGMTQLVRRSGADIKRLRCMSKKSEILSMRVDEMQLRLLSRELCRWRMHCAA